MARGPMARWCEGAGEARWAMDAMAGSTRVALSPALPAFAGLRHPASELPLPIFSWRHASPFLEGTMERAGFGEPHALGHLLQRQVGVFEQRDGGIAAQPVLDALVAAALVAQP